MTDPPTSMSRSIPAYCIALLIYSTTESFRTPLTLAEADVTYLDLVDEVCRAEMIGINNQPVCV